MLPPLNPLRVFVAAARVESFTQAAAEMNVSQSAVSRQIGVLEGYLGVQLFRRERDGVSLTEAGEAYYRQTAPAFGAIEAATGQIVQDKSEKPLRLRVYTTFAAKWLIGRMGELQREYPGIKIHLSHAVKPVNFKRDPVDVAIQFGDGDSTDAHSELLMKDILQPVCSPSLLRGKNPPIEIEDLRNHRLIHTRYRRSDWSDWLSSVGRLDLMDKQGLEFDSSVLTYQAAADGVGIAIGQINLLRSEISAGSLVPLFNQSLERNMGYYILWPIQRNTSRNLINFLSWLRREARLHGDAVNRELSQASKRQSKP